MRVLVIGGTNFIVAHVVTALHRQGHEVTVYHRGLHEPELPATVRHIHSHRASIPVLHFPSSLSDPTPDVVLHMFPVGEDDARAAVDRFVGVACLSVAATCIAPTAGCSVRSPVLLTRSPSTRTRRCEKSSFPRCMARAIPIAVSGSLSNGWMTEGPR